MKTRLITGASPAMGWGMTTKPLERGDRVVAWALTLTADKV
jgi:NAD(P)-dependent dehydrogenase (short-subunit alcohol dehydrogenase family)